MATREVNVYLMRVKSICNGVGNVNVGWKIQIKKGIANGFHPTLSTLLPFNSVCLLCIYGGHTYRYILHEWRVIALYSS